WYWQTNHLLWLALALFMAMRSVTLGWKINYSGITTYKLD
ncbi:MAG: hypothetical protein RLZZ535_2404, partial [Cyanobacteriota bacterium]